LPLLVFGIGRARLALGLEVRGDHSQGHRAALRRVAAAAPFPRRVAATGASRLLPQLFLSEFADQLGGPAFPVNLAEARDPGKGIRCVRAVELRLREVSVGADEKAVPDDIGAVGDERAVAAAGRLAEQAAE